MNKSALQSSNFQKEPQPPLFLTKEKSRDKTHSKVVRTEQPKQTKQLNLTNKKRGTNDDVYT